MAQLVVRNIGDDVKRRLKKRAEMHGHSMEEEVRQILQAAAYASPGSERGLGTRIANRFRGIGGLPEIEEFHQEMVIPEFGGPDFSDQE